MMAELKRKEQDLTTADLAGLSGEKNSATPEIRGKQESHGPSLVKEGVREQAKTIQQQERTPSLNSAPLFSEADVNDLRGRWGNVQSNFVDEPRRAVEEADKLVATVMQRLADGFASERSNLEKQWDRGDNVSTDDLRVALQRYRSFFDRLLNA